MKSPIERAARALCSLEGHPENIQFEGKPMWQSYVPNAHAVLAAIREPTEEMIDAGEIPAGMRCEEAEHVRENAKDTWLAMIDAALAEQR